MLIWQVTTKRNEEVLTESFFVNKAKAHREMVRMASEVFGDEERELYEDCDCEEYYNDYKSVAMYASWLDTTE